MYQHSKQQNLDLLSRLCLKENFIHQLHKIVPNEFNLLLSIIRVFDLVCQNLTFSPLFSEMFLCYGSGGRQSRRKADDLSQSDTASTESAARSRSTCKVLHALSCFCSKQFLLAWDGFDMLFNSMQPSLKSKSLIIFNLRHEMQESAGVGNLEERAPARRTVWARHRSLLCCTCSGVINVLGFTYKLPLLGALVSLNNVLH